MAIIQDGNQAFGISTPTFAELIVENFTTTAPSDSVELQDGDGLDIGRTTVPRARTFSATLQLGSGTTPTVGNEITYDSDTWVIQEAEKTEEQAEYTRVSVSGYEKINA